MQAITYLVYHLRLYIRFSLLEPSWAQICPCHLGSPKLLWQHCVHWDLWNRPQVLPHPACNHLLAWQNWSVLYPHVSAQGMITLDFSSLQLFYFHPLSIYTPRGSSLLFSVLPLHISNIQGHSPSAALGSLWDYHKPSKPEAALLHAVNHVH